MTLVFILSRVLFSIERYLYSSIVFVSFCLRSLFMESRQLNSLRSMRYSQSFYCSSPLIFRMDCLMTISSSSAERQDIDMFLLESSTLEFCTDDSESFNLVIWLSRSSFSCFHLFSFSRWQRHSRQQCLLHFSILFASCFSAISSLNSFWKKQFTQSSLELLSSILLMQAQICRKIQLRLARIILLSIACFKELMWSRISYLWWWVNLLKTRLFFGVCLEGEMGLGLGLGLGLQRAQLSVGISSLYDAEWCFTNLMRCELCDRRSLFVSSSSSFFFLNILLPRLSCLLVMTMPSFLESYRYSLEESLFSRSQKAACIIII